MLDGNSWRRVPGGLLVDTSCDYAAFSIGADQARNFRTDILQLSLNGQQRSYNCNANHADASRRSFRLPSFEQVDLRSTAIDGPFYHQPGLPVSHNGWPPTNYYWRAQWGIDVSTGYIIQRIQTTINATSCSGNAAAPVTGTPLYWEAWHITGPNTFSPHAFDIWTIDLSAGTRGTWSKQGDVYWVPDLDAAWGFRAGSVANAGLLKSTSVPVRDLGQVIMSRTRAGRWDGCQGNVLLNTHVEN